MNPIELLKRLIAMPSVTPDAGGALDVAQDILSRAGFAAERMPSGGVDNLWATLEFGESPMTIFAGHVDVVPPGDLDAWTHSPFSAAERDGFIYGRGACDMKGGVAAMMCALLREAKRHNRRGCAALLLTSDEEGPAVHGTRHVVDTLRARGVRGDFCLSAEPTCISEFGDAIKIGRRGSLSGSLKVFGLQGHSAYPHLADNAARRLLSATTALLRAWENQNVESKQDGIFPNDGMEIVALESGAGAFNVIPGTALARVNFRFAPPQSGNGLMEWAENVLREWEKEVGDDRKGGWGWEWEWVSPCSEPYGGSADGVLTGILREEVARRTGLSPELSGGGGASDGRFLRLLCGEVAEFGPVGQTMHQANERVRAEDVLALTDILQNTLARLSGSSVE